MPVCQHIPADWMEAAVVDAFFQARSPIELAVYARAVAAPRHTAEAAERARQQHLERRRYQAALAQRPSHRGDPDHRRVAAALEARWEAAWRALTHAEDTAAHEQAQPVVPCVLTAARHATVSPIGPPLPPLGGPQVLSQPQRNALRRCLLDTVALPRVARPQAQVRLVWRGGETTTWLVPVNVQRLAALPRAAALAPLRHDLCAAGDSDAAMAERWTARGHRSPSSQDVWPTTVRRLRFQPRLFPQRSQSHPRRIAGALTVPPLARALAVPVHWLDEHIHRGTMAVTHDPTTRVYVLPDRPHTLKLFKALQAGTRRQIRCHEDPLRGSRAPDAVEEDLSHLRHA